jgi:hypothetical protein
MIPCDLLRDWGKAALAAFPAALSGPYPNAPGSAGGYLLRRERLSEGRSEALDRALRKFEIGFPSGWIELEAFARPEGSGRHCEYAKFQFIVLTLPDLDCVIRRSRRVVYFGARYTDKQLQRVTA